MSRDQSIRVKLSAAEKAQITEAAEQSGASVAVWCRMVLLKQARSETPPAPYERTEP